MQDENLRKGPWLDEEDERLAYVVTILGERRWDALAKASGLRRSGKSCRLRWMNYLRPNIKHGDITEDEERQIIKLQKQMGNKWSKIAKQLSGRTDNEIKNYWRSHLRKKALIYEQECSGSNTTSNNSEPKSSIGKDDHYSCADSLAATEDFNYSFDDDDSSRLLDRKIPSWSYEQSQMEHHMYFCRLNLCSCNYPQSTSHEDNSNISSTWDGSSCSIWE
ncbi:transcription factor MYB59-like [Lycium ferocissimum]|uniref:transcription factor MYB59-like n=1 Tax=Lycium ferocissimum TaxID=112874 RepID=UPI0028158B03|nr:transcription factor MYB59-like [Lycium ferocissimum]